MDSTRTGRGPQPSSPSREHPPTSDHELNEPGGGLALTTTWEPGALIADNHGLLLPAGTPPGDYRLLLGLYDLEDPNSRLPVFDAGGASLGDSLLLATISVR